MGQRGSHSNMLCEYHHCGVIVQSNLSSLLLLCLEVQKCMTFALDDSCIQWGTVMQVNKW